MWWAMLMMLRITTVLMRSQPVTLLTRDPSPQPGTVGTPVVSSWHLHHSSMSWGHARNENVGFVDYFDCHVGVVDDGGLGTLPQLSLVQMVPLLSPCMNISHRTAICLWLYLIAEMMMLTMVMVFSARRGIQGLCCYQCLNQMLWGANSHTVIKHNSYLAGWHHLILVMLQWHWCHQLLIIVIGFSTLYIVVLLKSITFHSLPIGVFRCHELSPVW